MVVSRRKIILIAALGAIGLALLIGGFHLAGQAKHIALRRITAAVDSALHEPYRFELETFRVRLLDGMIAIPGLRIYPDSAALAAMDEPPRMLYSIECGRVEVRIRGVRRGVLEVRSVELTDPRVTLHIDPSRPRQLRTPHDRAFKLPFDYLSLRKVSLTGGRLRYDSLAVDGIDLELRQVLVDTALSVSLPPAELHMAALRFSRHTPTDATRLQTGPIDVAGIDLIQLIENQTLAADSIAVAALDLHSTKDRRVRSLDRIKPLLHQLVQRLPIGLDVGTIALRDSRAGYEEWPATGAQAGEIFLSDITARLDSLNNLPDGPDRFTLDATGRIYGAGAVRVQADFPADSLDEHFAMRGWLGPMALETFNPMIRPLGHLSVHSGRLQQLYFNLEGDSYNGLITMRMEYDSLRVDLLNRQGVTAWLGSALANGLLIKDANPMPGQEVREVTATAARNPYRSHFNYLWRMFFAGVKPSVGISEQEQQAVTTLQQKWQQLRERIRERRAARQAARKGG